MSVSRALRPWHRRSPATASLDGKLISPEDPAFDDARRAWNLAVEQRPAAVVTAESVDDVVAAVALAQERGLRLAPQCTGHGAAPLGSLHDTILLRTDGLRGVRVDPTARVVRVQAGVSSGEAVAAAAAHGLALPAGSATDVGLVGYTLGGGIGWLARRHGVAASHVEAIELVSAGGELVRADRDHEADLFWALRGGGGSFGVVTALEFRALPLTDVYAGVLWWPIERDQEALHAWRELAEGDLPDELTTVARYLQLPDLPFVPEPLRGRAFVVVEAYHLGEREQADALLAPLRALGPENDTIATVPVTALGHVHMDPEQPVASAGDGVLLGALPTEAIDKLIRIAGGGVDSPLLTVEVRQLGGALARPAPGGGALDSIEASYAVYAGGMAPAEPAARAVRAYLEHLRAGLEPWTAPAEFLNFAETPRPAGAFWSEAAHRRLRQIKGRVDPDELIRANHSVTPA